MQSESVSNLSSKLISLINDTGFHIFEQDKIPQKNAILDDLPKNLHPLVKTWLNKNYNSRLYIHQSKALSNFLEGKDICIATATASGKSLIFISAALHLLLSDEDSKVLVFYPSRALIRDQMIKWKEACSTFGLVPCFIDGSVQVGLREQYIEHHRIILMTPDVAHAWLLNKLRQPIIQSFLSQLKLLIMDEAHVYDGVFGTNMAFFLRRLFAVSNINQVITSTATIGDAKQFIEALTGRAPYLIDSSIDGAPSPQKQIYSLISENGGFFEKSVALVNHLGQLGLGRFLVFADSRKMVEQIVAIAERLDIEEENEQNELDKINQSILPYRAGYEEEDRADIQDALSNGTLAGVVSTSALELGLDIGDIDIVVLLRTPKNIKSFRQRIGRVGRKHEGYVIIINDIKNPTGNSSLNSLLSMKPEKSWLYLDNIYIQYIHALCAVQEITDWGSIKYDRKPFASLPASFTNMLNNEITPTEGILPELYPLKQRAQNDPHFEFALRSDSGKNFIIAQRYGPNINNLGSVTYSQALREAYPGAMYYYMAKPYRVTKFSYRTAEISVSKGIRYTTQPLLQNMVFPKVNSNIRNCKKSFAGFLMEADLQINERVIGFKEIQGKKSLQYIYGPDSEYYQRPLIRFFESTGIIWFLPDTQLLNENFAKIILNTYSSACGIQERDLDVGSFYMRSSPIWTSECTGLCIYDTTPGSLRLSHRLFDDFKDILDLSRILIEEREDIQEMNMILDEYLKWISTLHSFNVSQLIMQQDVNEADDNWVIVVAPNQKAIFKDLYTDEEVTILEYRYTPHGLMYRLETNDKSETRLVPHANIIPLPGETIMIEANLTTGEIRDIKSDMM